MESVVGFCRSPVGKGSVFEFNFTHKKNDDEIGVVVVTFTIKSVGFHIFYRLRNEINPSKKDGDNVGPWGEGYNGTLFTKRDV